MKYTLQVDIERPRVDVVELFADPDHWPEWREGLVSSQALEGVPGEMGATTRLVHRFGRRLTEIIETIESKRPPEEITCVYEAPGAWNRVVNRFRDMGPAATRWELETEFRCVGFLRILAFLRPGVFRHATLKEMTSFKRFAESR